MKFMQCTVSTANNKGSVSQYMKCPLELLTLQPSGDGSNCLVDQLDEEITFHVNWLGTGSGLILLLWNIKNLVG